ncbi:hypothetical protein AVDCRST_MAG81-1176 [uncultured Synechococcales cyanobacterium]|uniref:Uncharacterized protein n=1 Tax=uncultured Synechococcales cyanobacterium TaxID=1936017 RepID=A0A6J4V0H3_9CYAN|nr:hypothetical protein AVDCRST_MAG81-1176 [uncultured Synechococcales cyanobacterium]
MYKFESLLIRPHHGYDQKQFVCLNKPVNEAGFRGTLALLNYDLLQYIRWFRLIL